MYDTFQATGCVAECIINNDLEVIVAFVQIHTGPAAHSNRAGFILIYAVKV